MYPPLQGRRILVTRPRGQASALADLLAQQGAIPILIPTIELAPPRSWCALDAALASIRSFDWLLFTSANAVQAYMDRARTLKLAPQAKRIAAIGPATAKAIQQTGLAPEVDLIPEHYVAESFAEALIPQAPGASMLLVRAAAARDTLPETLAAAGATLTLAEAYQTIIPESSITALRDLFNAGPQLDAITFTSASTAQNLAALLESAGLTLPPATTLASIGPITSQAMRDLGLSPTLEASESTILALLEALGKHFTTF
jgi:uroporphyrinogen-III synthase